MIGRREFITLLGAAAWPLAARAQDPAPTVRQARIGILSASAPTPAMVHAFRERMRERGYIEGHNLSIYVRWPRGTFEQDPAVAAELAKANVDVSPGPRRRSSRSPRNACNSNRHGVGRRPGPGGNITGFSNISADLSAKLVVFVELVPDIRRVGVVSNIYNPNVALQLRQTEEAVRKLGLQSLVIEAQTPEEYERAFARLSAEKVHGVVLLATSSLIEHAHRIAELARAARLPTAFQRRENVEAGGLMSYGGNINYQFRGAASYVDRLLKGPKPVEQPTKLEFVINLKTAKSLGLTVPTIMQMTADEVIE
jgi:putative ABC transport system substrate-binding protein